MIMAFNNILNDGEEGIGAIAFGSRDPVEGDMSSHARGIRCPVIQFVGRVLS